MYADIQYGIGRTVRIEKKIERVEEEEKTRYLRTALVDMDRMPLL